MRVQDMTNRELDRAIELVSASKGPANEKRRELAALYAEQERRRAKRGSPRRGPIADAEKLR